MKFWGRSLNLRGSLSHSLHRRRQSRSSDDSYSTGKRADFRPRQPGRKKSFAKDPGVGRLLLVTTLLAILIFLVKSHGHSPRKSRKEAKESTPAARTLQLLVPVSRTSGVDLCKTILCAQVLNYPIPNIVPWGNSSDGSPLPKGQRLLDKASKIHDALKDVPPHADDGITILLDGPNTWFQLRPDLLLQSYYRVTAQANHLLEEKYGGQFIKQKAIFAAQPGCSSKEGDDKACDAAPEPPRPDLARHLGHGAIVGETKAVRAIMQRAVERFNTASPTKLVQIFAEIFGEQELNRNLLPVSHSRMRIWTKKEHKRDDSKALPDQQQPMPTKQFNATYEFGIGLDYYNDLGILASPTMGSDSISWQSPATNSILSDLEVSTPPFWTVSGSEPSLPHSAKWTDVQLLTVPRTGSVPAMIHHTPTAISGRDSTGLRKEWWPKLWLVNHARALYTAAERVPKTIVANVVDDMGRESTFWNPKVSMLNAGAWSMQKQWVHWEGMCGAEQVWSEVFRDEIGPWKRTEEF